MEDKSLDIDKIVKYWVLSSDNDFQTMHNLYESKDFHWALFLGHLVIEKLLKAKIVQVTGKHAPFSHDLRKLANEANLSLSEYQRECLDIITTFNLNARYDDYKQAFFNRCTKNFTQE